MTYRFATCDFMMQLWQTPEISLPACRSVACGGNMRNSTANGHQSPNRFDKEHTHSEDEVRFILSGRGIFFFNIQGRVVSVEVGPGDLLRVPTGVTHWFTLCEDRRIRAIRWFQDTSGWTPHYTESGKDRDYEPVCLGPSYLPSSLVPPDTARIRS